jgi:hypothetical protein
VQAGGRPPQRALDGAPICHERHRPEQTTVYLLVQQQAAGFEARLAVVPRFERPLLSPCRHMLHHDQPQALAARLAFLDA